MSTPNHEHRSDEIFLEIVVRLRPIDPTIGTSQQPLEATRDDLAAAANIPVQSEAATEPESALLPKGDRERQLESDILRDAEDSLKEMTREALVAVTNLMKEASARGAANLLAHAERALYEAQRRAASACSLLNSTWTKCVPTPPECIKDIIKYSIRVAIVYAIWQAMSSLGM